MTTFQSSWHATAAVCALCVAGVPGCSSENDVLPQERDVLTAPESFEDDRQIWRSAGDLSAADVRRLRAYFGQNPSVAENSIVRGDPLVYATADGARRYYWVRPGHDGTEWLCLQFGKRSVQMKDGSGAPFPNS